MHHALVALLALAALLLPGGVPAQTQQPLDPARRARQELLVSHGVDTNPTTLVRFLNEGFFIQLPRGLPQEPQMKSEVLNAAIIETGMQKIEAAVPVLRRIARRERVQSVGMILARDLEREPLEIRDRLADNLERFFSLNAITALGWIGDPVAAPTVLEVMRAENGSAFVTKGAVALAMMGSAEGLGSLVILASDEKNLDCIAAFEAVWFITGRNYGCHQWTSLAKRRALIRDLRAWYEKEGATVPAYRTEVIRRLQQPVRWDNTEPGTLRHLLRASRDLDDFDRRFYARDRLKTLVPGQFDTLLAISNDKLEDVDLRLAAMQYLAAVDPRKARRHINRLEKDENDPVVEIAKSLDRDIQEALEAAKRKK